MIRIECDKCEKTIEVEDSLAGTKIECPNCGDVNRIPYAPSGKPEPAPAPGLRRSGSSPVASRADRPAALGLPPDSGPERHVLTIKPAMFRAHPFLGAVVTVIWIGGIAAALYFRNAWWLIATGMGLIFLTGWWIKRQTIRLEITNKRCVLRKGLFSRATSEVLHDHVRNIQTGQTLVGRIFNVGSVGISSAGQDDIEIEVPDLPNPGKIRGIIDAYRPL